MGKAFVKLSLVLTSLFSQQILAVEQQAPKNLPKMSYSFSSTPPFEAFVNRITRELENIQTPISQKAEMEKAVGLFDELNAETNKLFKSLQESVKEASVNVPEVNDQLKKLNLILNLANKHKGKNVAFDLMDSLGNTRFFNSLYVKILSYSMAMPVEFNETLKKAEESVLINNEIMKFQMRLTTKYYSNFNITVAQAKTLKQFLLQIENTTSQMEHQFNSDEYALTRSKYDSSAYSDSRIGFTSLSEEIPEVNSYVREMLTPVADSIAIFQNFLTQLEYTPWGGNKTLESLGKANGQGKRVRCDSILF